MSAISAKPCRHSRCFSGIGVSPGLAAGPGWRLTPVVPRSAASGAPLAAILPDEAAVAAEINRFETAVAGAEAQLRAARAALAPRLGEYAPLLESHFIILRDPRLYQESIAAIRQEKIPAEAALARVEAKLAATFAGLADPYLRDRFQDVAQAVERIRRQLAGEGPAVNACGPLSQQAVWPGERLSSEASRFGAAGAVAVARQFTPEDLLRLAEAGAVALVSETGGATCHIALLARSLGLPAVLGVSGISEQLQPGDLVAVDGDGGRVELLAAGVDHEGRQPEVSDHGAPRDRLPFRGRLRLEANFNLVVEAEAALAHGAAGVGLFRSEYTWLTAAGEPRPEAELVAEYRQLLAAFAPRPVTIRTLDFGGDKVLRADPGPAEENPALGLRGIRFSLARPAWFRRQLRALLRAGVGGNLRIMLPLVSDLAEVRRTRAIIAEVAAELAAAGTPFAPNVPFGVMIETPAAVMMAAELARDTDFFSIGSNDLSQYALAVDRGNARLAECYDQLHPAVLRLIRQTATAGQRAGIPVSLCGELAAEPLAAPLLYGLGLAALSLPPAAIPAVKAALGGHNRKAAGRLARAALACATAAEVRNLLNR